MTIRYAERARRDVEGIASYLTAHNPKGAERVGAAIRRGIQRLADHPLSGRVQDHPDNVRKLVVPAYGYLVYYPVVSASDVMILTIRHAAQARVFEDR